MKLKVEIEVDNDAFQQGSLEGEIGRILNLVSSRIQMGSTGGTLFDINGNNVGSFSLESEI